MKLKKILSTALAVATAATMASCGSKSADNGDVTLTWLLPGDAQADMVSVAEKVNEITTEKIGAKVDIQFIDTGAYTEKMKMNMASGMDFDICFAGFVNNYTDGITKGGFMDITDLLDEVPALKEAVSDYAWDASKYDGRIYGVPNEQIFATAYSFAINMDIASKYDFDFSTVKSIEDLEPYFEMIKENEPNIYPYRANAGLAPWYVSKYEGLGGFTVIPKGSTSVDEICLLEDTPEFKAAAAKMHEYYQKGYIRSDILSMGDDTNDYKNGKYAVTDTVWKPGAEVELQHEIGSEILVIPYEQPYLTKSKTTATMACIGKNSKHPELALKFIELINTDKDLYNLVCFGIQDKHYTINENSKVELIPDSGYAPNASWKFGIQFNALICEGQDDDVWEVTKKTNDESEKSSLLGFDFDKSAVRTELSNIATVTSEYKQKYECGVSAPEEYMDEFRAKLIGAGQEKIMEEYKKQLSEYFASK